MDPETGHLINSEGVVIAPLSANVISYNAAIWFLLLAIAPLSANVISYNAAISAGVKGWSSTYDSCTRTFTISRLGHTNQDS